MRWNDLILVNWTWTDGYVVEELTLAWDNARAVELADDLTLPQFQLQNFSTEEDVKEYATGLFFYFYYISPMSSSGPTDTGSLTLYLEAKKKLLMKNSFYKYSFYGNKKLMIYYSLAKKG